MRTDWHAFDAAYPEEFAALALLLQLQQESHPAEIPDGLRGAIKGQFVEHLESEDDGRYFLDTIWGIRSTTHLSQARGSILMAWLKTPDRVAGMTNAEQLPHLVETMRSFDAAEGDPTVQAALAIGATARALPMPPEPETPPPITQQEESVAFEPKPLTLLNVVDMLKPEEGTEMRLQGIPEAPASFNFFASIKGFNGQWTLRDWNEAELLDRVYALIEGLEELGARPTDRYGNAVQTTTNNSVVQKTTTPSGTTAPAVSAGPLPRGPQPPPAVADLAAGEQAMRVSKIEVNTTKAGDPSLHLWGPNRQYADLYWNFGIESFFVTCPDMRGDGPGQFVEDALTPFMEDGKIVKPTYDGSWVAVWVESEKANSKGFPYKNIVRCFPTG